MPYCICLLISVVSRSFFHPEYICETPIFEISLLHFVEPPVITSSWSSKHILYKVCFNRHNSFLHVRLLHQVCFSIVVDIKSKDVVLLYNWSHQFHTCSDVIPRYSAISSGSWSAIYWINVIWHSQFSLYTHFLKNQLAFVSEIILDFSHYCRCCKAGKFIPLVIS